MVHFMQNLVYYMMFEVIEPYWHNTSPDFSKVKDYMPKLCWPHTSLYEEGGYCKFLQPNSCYPFLKQKHWLNYELPILNITWKIGEVIFKYSPWVSSQSLECAVTNMQDLKRSKKRPRSKEMHALNFRPCTLRASWRVMLVRKQSMVSELNLIQLYWRLWINLWWTQFPNLILTWQILRIGYFFRMVDK